MGNPAQVSRKSKHYQGLYEVKNPDKYIGDPRECIYRSSWERKIAKHFDMNPDIVRWAMEPFAIPYISPKDGKTHRYFPDFIVIAKHPKTGDYITTIIEVKPYAETLPPKGGKGKPKQRLLKETLTYHVNQAKWAAAKELCQRKGWQFKVMTEKQIKPKYPSQG